MKKLIILLFVVSVFSACTKKDVDPKPSVDAVVGKYDISYVSTKSKGKVSTLSDLPITVSGVRYSATAELTSTLMDEIDIRISLLMNGKDDDPADLEGMELRKKGKGYGLYLSDQLVADLDGKTIDFNLTATQNGEETYLRFKAKR